jgi:antitoxin MazE
MRTTIQEWGNSLGIRIPKAIAKELSLRPGLHLTITIENNHIALYPQKYCLDDMLNQITEDNKHGLEWNDNDRQGAEEW